MDKFGIIGAEEQEIELLKSYFEGKIIKKFGLEIYDGCIFGKEVVFACAGVGKVNASLCTQVLISNFNATMIINCGIAGAISDTLSILDIVVSEKAFQHDVDATYFGYKLGEVPKTEKIFWTASQKLISATLGAYEKLKQGIIEFDTKNIFTTSSKITSDFQKSKMIKGVIASGDIFVVAEKDRNRITKICPETACVEMEGAAIAQVATINQIPFVILRSISDSADENDLEKMGYDEFSKRAALMSAALILQMLKTF